MEGLGSIIKSVCIISAAICIIDNLASGTRFRNQMKFLLNLVFITIIVTPVLKGTFDFELPEVESYINQDISKTEEIYYEELKLRTSENISSVLKSQIEAAGINCSNVRTDVNISETNSISINSVTIKTDNFEAASAIVKNSMGTETEVLDGNF